MKISNPQWANTQQTLIDCIVLFDHIDQAVIFTANPDEPEQYGREIFTRCVSGEFGEILPYIPPTVPTTTTETIQ